MKFFDQLIRKKRQFGSIEYLFEIRQGDHTCLVPFEAWYREHKEKITINFQNGHVGDSCDLVRVHPVVRIQGKLYGR